MDQFRAVVETAQAQHGLITRRQVTGVSPSKLQRWMAGGRLEVVFPGVYRLAGVPATWEQRVLAAVLAAGDGAVASHRSAAALWDLLDDDTVEVSVPPSRTRRLAGFVAHRSGDLDSAAVVRRRGTPSTAPARTLVDLGAVVPSWTVEDALDRALVRRLVTVSAVERELEALGCRGRSGAGVLRQVLDARALGTQRPDGLLEPRMARLLRDHGLPEPTFQYEVRHHGRFVARVDFAYPAFRLAIEVDGFGTHGSPRALQADLERQNALVALGWTVLRFTWADVVHRPEKVAFDISRVLCALTSA